MKSKPVIVFTASVVLLWAVFAGRHTSGGLRTDEGAGISDNSDRASVVRLLDDVSDVFTDQQSGGLPIRWFYTDTSDKPKGVAMVIHGLNLNPEKMLPIISTLTESGIDVLNLSLRGHGENFRHEEKTDADTARLEAFRGVSYKLWLNEAYLAYSQAHKRAERNTAPLFLVAFSLGGLIGLDLFASNSEVQFDRQVLFAPAIALQSIIYIERVLSPFPRLVIPSLAPKDYLANKNGTPIAAYNALFDGLDHFAESGVTKINVPTLVLIDEQDEFIPLWKLKKLVEENNWNQWQFYIVQKEKKLKSKTFHHHIIDAYSTGDTVWQDIEKTVRNHLLNHSSY